MISRPSPRLLSVLQDAGWSPSRDVSQQAEKWLNELCERGRFPRLEVARAILGSFGGLHLQPSGHGEDFAPGPIDFDPLLAIGEEDRFQRFEEGKRKLFPLGEVDNGHAFLAVDDEGHLYVVGDELMAMGDSLEEGLSNLIHGRRHRSER